MNAKIVDPGQDTLRFNGTGYLSGVYFYQLNTVTFSETKKMLLLK